MRQRLGDLLEDFQTADTVQVSAGRPLSRQGREGEMDVRDEDKVKAQPQSGSPADVKNFVTAKNKKKNHRRILKKRQAQEQALREEPAVPQVRRRSAGPGDTKPISVITVDTSTAYPGISDSFTAFSDNAFPGVDMSTECPGNLDVVNASPANDYRK